MKKIALEEHFTRPDLLTYNQQAFGVARPEVMRGIAANLPEIGERRLAIMDEAGIEVSVLSNISPGVHMEPDPGKAQRLAQELNDYLAEQIAPWPRRLYGFAHLSMHDPGAAADELERCVRELGFKGAMLNGHTMGSYLDADRYLPFWERVEAMGAPIYLHPTYPMETAGAAAGHPVLAGAGWSWMAETGAHALRLILSGLFDRYAGLQVVLGHMGEGLPFNISRVDEIHSRMQNSVELRRKPSDYLRDHFFITPTGVYSAPALRCSIDTMGIERILFSVDAPLEDSKTASQFIETAPLTTEERQMICHGNAARLLGISL